MCCIHTKTPVYISMYTLFIWFNWAEAERELGRKGLRLQSVYSLRPLWMDCVLNTVLYEAKGFNPADELKTSSMFIYVGTLHKTVIIVLRFAVCGYIKYCTTTMVNYCLQFGKKAQKTHAAIRCIFVSMCKVISTMQIIKRSPTQTQKLN